MKTVTPEEMRSLERRSEKEGVSTDALMEQAGLLAARKAWMLLGGNAYSSRIIFLIGAGNNGSDGLVTARHLQAWGAHVTSFLLASRPTDDLKLQKAINGGVTVVDAFDSSILDALRGALSEATMVVDAVLGIGLSHPLEGVYRDVLAATNEEHENRTDILVFAIDVPSGVDAKSGLADASAISADATVTFGFPKSGLFQFPGASLVGEITVADIGIPEFLAEDIQCDVVTRAWARTNLPNRPLSAHKGTFGRVLALVGSINYVGAAYLACMGSARSGSGYVTLATTRSFQALTATKLTEPTYLLVPEGPDGNPIANGASTIRDNLPSYNVLLAGCGLGQHDGTNALLEQILLSATPLGVPVVLDADALNTLAQIPDWWSRLQTPTVVTPHPGEMSRLLGKTIADIEGDRVGTAYLAAKLWGVTVLLKGAYTVVASPKGDVRIIPFANPGLATAGTGDVLAGIIAGLIAQHMSPYDAATLGAFIHGATGEMITNNIGNTGIIASDLLPMLPTTVRAIREGTFTGGIQEIS